VVAPGEAENGLKSFADVARFLRDSGLSDDILTLGSALVDDWCGSDEPDARVLVVRIAFLLRGASP
jgi:hypothetical protein